MGFEALHSMSTLAAQSEPAEDRTLLPAAGEDGGLWKRLVNLRYRVNEGYLYWQRRGGTRTWQTNLNSVDGAQVLTLEAFETAAGGQQYAFLMIHTAAGSLWYYDLNQSSKQILVDGADPGGLGPLSLTEPVTVINIGRSVYIFDGQAGVQLVYDLITGQTHRWNQSIAGTVAGAFGAEGSPQPWPERNVFGFGKGAEVISLVEYEDRRQLNTLSRTAWLYQNRARMCIYVPAAGRDTIELEDGRKISSLAIFFKPDGVGIRSGSNVSSTSPIPSGELPLVYEAVNYRASEAHGTFGIPARPEEDPEALFAPRRAVIDSFETLEAEVLPGPPPIVGDFGMYRIKEQGSVISPVRVVATPVLQRSVIPFTAELRKALDHPSKYVINRETGEIDTRTDYEPVTLHRAYQVVHLLADGSVTLPGRPAIVQAAAADIAQNRYSHVALTLPEVTDAQVSKRLLMSTRWQLSADACMRPTSSDNPNGAFFVNAELETRAYNGAGAYQDYTPDSDLLRPMSEYVPTLAGIPVVFGAGQLSPRVAAGSRNSLLLGNYTINRPVPEAYTSPEGPGNSYVQHTTGSALARTLSFQFEYADGSYSTLTDTALALHNGAGNQVTVHGLNSQVAAVAVLSRQGTTYRLIKRATLSDPEFTGLPIALPASTGVIDALPVYTAPGADRVREQSDQQGSLVITLPAQNPSILSQYRLQDFAAISGLVPLRFDADKTELRYQLAITTDRNVQIGYLTEQATQTGPAVTANFEVVFEGAGAERNRIFRAGGMVFLESREGVYTLQGGVQLLIDRRRYPDAVTLRKVVYHGTEKEIWFVFAGQREVIVLDTVAYSAAAAERRAGGYLRRYRWDGSDIPCQATRWRDTLFMGLGTRVMEADAVTDGDMVGASKTAAIIATAETTFLGAPQEQMRLIELAVAGSDGSCTPTIDLQIRRLEPSDYESGGGTDWVHAFQADLVLPAKPLRMYGTPWDVVRRAVMPRVRLQFTVDATDVIEHVRVRSVRTSNTGKARQDQL